MTLRVGGFTMLTLILACIKAMGAPLPIWLVVLPCVVDLCLVGVALLLALVAVGISPRGHYRFFARRS